VHTATAAQGGGRARRPSRPYAAPQPHGASPTWPWGGRLAGDGMAIGPCGGAECRAVWSQVDCGPDAVRHMPPPTRAPAGMACQVGVAPACSRVARPRRGSGRRAPVREWPCSPPARSGGGPARCSGSESAQPVSSWAGHGAMTSKHRRARRKAAVLVGAGDDRWCSRVAKVRGACL
jgi:hypothetical protein